MKRHEWINKQQAHHIILLNDAVCNDLDVLDVRRVVRELLRGMLGPLPPPLAGLEGVLCKIVEHLADLA